LPISRSRAAPGPRAPSTRPATRSPTAAPPTAASRATRPSPAGSPRTSRPCGSACEHRLTLPTGETVRPRAHARGRTAVQNALSVSASRHLPGCCEDLRHRGGGDGPGEPEIQHVEVITALDALPVPVSDLDAPMVQQQKERVRLPFGPSLLATLLSELLRGLRLEEGEVDGHEVPPEIRGPGRAEALFREFDEGAGGGLVVGRQAFQRLCQRVQYGIGFRFATVKSGREDRERNVPGRFVRTVDHRHVIGPQNQRPQGEGGPLTGADVELLTPQRRRARTTEVVRALPGARGGATRSDQQAHLLILVTWPAPTVRPPSRMANFRPSSMATGWMSSTFISVLSPGMTISVPSGRVTTPVTSVVRK